MIDALSGDGPDVAQWQKALFRAAHVIPCGLGLLLCVYLGITGQPSPLMTVGMIGGLAAMFSPFFLPGFVDNMHMRFFEEEKRKALRQKEPL